VVMSGGSADPMLSASPLATPGTHTVIGLPPGAASGTYQVRANASAATADSVVIVSYFSASTVRAGITTDALVYRLGDTVLLSGLVFDGTAPLNHASLIARVGIASDTMTPPSEVVLHDSGTFDDRAGDGVYTGELTANVPGTFTVALRATGLSSAGVLFSRAAGTTFRVLPPIAAFEDLSDAGIDDDGDGLVDRVLVTANVAVQTAGRYQFGISLEAPNGARTNGRASGDLPSGSSSLAVSFAAADLRRLGGEGPHALKDAVLIALDDIENPTVDFRDEAGRTSVYPLLSLSPGDVAEGGPDLSSPSIVQPPDLVADSSSDVGAVVIFDLPDVVDDVDLAPNVSARPASGSLFPPGISVVTVTATDAAGNSSAVTFTVTVLDHAPPRVQCGAADNAWHSEDVSISCTASDSGSGLSNAAEANFALVTSVPVGTETVNALTNTRTVCDVAGNCATAGPVGGNRVDRMAPQVTVVSPASGTYTLNQAVQAAYTCADGAGLVSCSGTAADGANIDTSSPGPHTFTVTGTDLAGNSTNTSVVYHVSNASVVTSAGPASIWLGLKDSDDVGIRFDLLVEVLKKGVVVGSGRLNDVPGGSSGFKNAVSRVISVALGGPVTYQRADMLALRLSVRIASTGLRHRSGTARLWLNDPAANTRVSLTVNNVDRTFYLASGFSLTTTPPAGPRTYVDVMVSGAVGGSLFKPFGTWIVRF